MSTRREFSVGMLGTAAAAAVGAAVSRKSAAAAPSSDLFAPGQVHRLYRRVRYGADGQMVAWWMRGRRFGIVDNAMTPFFNMEVGSLHVARDLGEGRYRVTTLSAIYYTDLERGELLTDWPNPVTGRTVAFRYAAPQPSTRIYDYASGPEVESSSNGMRADRRVLIGPAEVIGDDVWLRDETYLTLTPEPRTAPAAASAPASAVSTPTAVPFSTRRMRVHDMYTYQCSLAALRGAESDFVPAVAQFNDFNDWSPRFEMGDRPGTTVSRCAGRKVRRLAEMPERWLSIARRLHGDAFKDPERVLAAGTAG